jgi:hypothetical protein
MPRRKGEGTWRPIYEGTRSAYARMEGAWVPGRGVGDAGAAASIAALIVRDYRRGWTYDHYGDAVPMTWDLARRRLLYLIPLAVKHGASRRDLRLIRDLVYRAAATGELPREYLPLVRLEGPQAERILAEVGARPRAAAVARRAARRRARA